MVTVMLTISATGMTTIAPSPRPKTARLAKAEAERARTDGRGRLSIENSLAGGGGDVGDSGVGNDDDGPPASIWCNTPLGLSSDLYDAPPNGPRITGDGGNAVGKARGRAEERGAATSAALTSSYSCSVVPQAAYLRRARARECMARIRAKSKEARDAVERIREKVATTVAADLRRARARERMARIRAKSKEARHAAERIREREATAVAADRRRASARERAARSRAKKKEARSSYCVCRARGALDVCRK